MKTVFVLVNLIIMLLAEISFGATPCPKRLDNSSQCLVCTIYHESRGEPFVGELAVALVTLNRVESDQYPPTICAVIWQKHQFSWTSGNSVMHDDAEIREATLVAYVAILMHRLHLGYILIGIGDNVMWFHNTSVQSDDFAKLQYVGQIGHHLFYAPI